MLPCRFALPLAVFAMVFAGCADRPHDPQPQGLGIDVEVHHPDLELLDPDDPANIQVMDGFEEDDPEIHQSNKDLEVETTNRFLFVGVAHVEAPSVGGDQVHVADLQLFREGRLGISVANFAGEDSRGAFQLLDLTSRNEPTLAAEVLMGDTEYNSVGILGDIAYLLGNNDDTACMDLFDISDLQNPTLLSRVPVAAHTALSMTIDEDNDLMYMITGADGGLHRFDLSDPLAPVETEFTPINDARHMAIDGHRLFVLHGAGVMVQELGHWRDYPLSGMTAQAPSRGSLHDGRFYVNTNDGIAMVDPRRPDSELVLADAQGTANGMAMANGQMFYRANGEAGLQVVQRRERRGNVFVRTLGTIDVANAGSSNSAAASNEMLLSGDGRGGVLLVRINPRYFGRS